MIGSMELDGFSRIKRLNAKLPITYNPAFNTLFFILQNGNEAYNAIFLSPFISYMGSL